MFVLVFCNNATLLVVKACDGGAIERECLCFTLYRVGCSETS